MLSRRWTLIVLAGWLAVTAVFVVRDLRPRWAVQEPAAFAISIGDEPKMGFVGIPKPRQVDTSWRVFRNGRERWGDVALSRVQYNHWSDTLEVSSDFRLRSARSLGSPWLEVQSRFRVDWDGALQELDVEMRLRREPLLLTNPALVGLTLGAWLPGLTEQMPHWPFVRCFPFEARVPAALVVGAWLPGMCRLNPDWPVSLRTQPPGHAEAGPPGVVLSFFPDPSRQTPASGRVSPEGPVALYAVAESWARCRGVVRKGQFLPNWQISGERRDPVFNPVPLSANGHVYVPFHPFNRLPGLRPGQRWSMPMLDLMAAMNMGQPREIRTVVAVVEETEPVAWHHRPQSVWLVTIRDGDRVWVRKSDDLVLRQELHFSADSYVLERDVSREPQLRGP